MAKKASKLTLNFPGVIGFERFPEGKLLSQIVEVESPVGIAYERCIGYTKSEHSHDRITITFPRGSSRSFIKVFPESRKDHLTEPVFHIMAKDHSHEQGSVSSIYDTFALLIDEKHYQTHLDRVGVAKRDVEPFIRTTETYSKSAVLNELIERYFFCRVLEEAPSAFELAHLESLIMSEVFTIAHRSFQTASRSNSEQVREKNSDETALVRAISYIETHLFEKLDVHALVQTSRTSQATLFRLFKKELKASPIEYVRNRRLDEARSLLQTGDYQVSDVALLVGYDDLSSFSKAFKARFKVPPSDFLSE